jgi:molecular chaperone HscB
VNEAYRALRDPVGRAQYLLSLHGIDPFAEGDSSLPHEFLERQLERREAVGDAAADGDVDALARLLAEVRAEHAGLESELGVVIDRDAAWSTARGVVRELKFLDKLADDIDATIGDLEA